MMQGYKTIFANIAMMFMVVADYIATNGETVKMVLSDHPQTAVGVIAAANVALRLATTTPAFKGAK